ncbi:Ger(x)C family spore germination protein [Paenibacillus sp. UNC451MF]|uniref:Ger(x)C family spore germination protein n=1 Tax=Paenibacillus sp. UNC451MF TaxID=1449063 RepID=UPI00068A4995|nr:Ger(x)C family spore germination protein [Paenibacillus sp. UNC451MF]
MGHVIVKSLCLCLVTLMLSGCWSRHELNDMSIAVGMGIDRIGDKYNVTVQTVNPGQVAVKKGPATNASPVITYEEVGATIPEALTRISVKVPRHLYFAHLRMVVIGEEVAKAGISKPLDYLSRNMEMRTDFYFVIAREAKAADILQVLTVMDPIPSNNMYTKLETSDNYWASTGSMNLNNLLQDLGANGKSPTMTGIEISGSLKPGDKTSVGQYVNPPALLKYAGMAAFNEDRFVGWLDENDTKALNYVLDSVHQSAGHIACPGGEGLLTMQVIRSKAVIKSSINNGKPEFDVNIRLEQDIADAECKIDLSNASIVNELKRKSDSQMEALISTSIKKIQKKYGTDIYGFGETLHQKHPKVWHEIKDWKQVFKTVKIRVHVNTILRRMGTILQPIDMITKE